MPLKQLLSASVIVGATAAGGPPASATNWDAELDGLKKFATTPAPDNFVGMPNYATEKKLSLAAFLKEVRDQNGGQGKFTQDLDMTPAAYAAFTKADADGDLSLNPDEWKTLMAILRPRHATKFNNWIAANQFPDTFQAMFDAGTKVDKTAFSAEVHKISSKSGKGLEFVAQATSLAAFDKADADENGELSREEFKTLVETNSLGSGVDAFKNWILKVSGEHPKFPVTVHADKLGDNTKKVAVDANDEIAENDFLKWVAPNNPPAQPKDFEDLMAAKKAFDLADVNGNHKLDKQEIATRWSILQTEDDAQKNLGFTPTTQDWAKAGHGLLPPGAAPQGLDDNADEKVSLTEFVLWAQDKDKTEGIVPQVVTAFNAADKNGDAALDRDELKTMLASVTSPAQSTDPDTSTKPSSCFTKDVDYYGHDLHTFMGKHSVTSCQKACGKVKGANYFQFMPPMHSKPSVCWCKSSKSGEKPHSHRTVGPIVCPEGLGLWESRAVDKPTKGVAMVGAVMGAGSLAMALVMWLAGKRFSGRPQQMEAVPLQVQE